MSPSTYTSTTPVPASGDPTNATFPSLDWLTLDPNFPFATAEYGSILVVFALVNGYIFSSVAHCPELYSSTHIFSPVTSSVT